MADAETVPSVSNETHGRSSSASNVYINNVGKTGVIVMVVAIGFALGMAVGAVVMVSMITTMMESKMNERIAAVERRAMDMAGLAEREARIAQDKYAYVQAELAKKGIYISTDGH